jgi:anti-sigma factor RsiW
MSCSDVLDLIEPIAAGDLRADEAVRAHLESCVTCAAALASAQRLEAALKAMEIPPAPATFAATMMQRVRRDRWQAEQNVDRLFNLAIVAAVLLMVGGLAAMLNVQGLLSISGSALVLVRESMRAGVQQAAPTLATYVAAACLLASALGMWWWAERRLMF